MKGDILSIQDRVMDTLCKKKLLVKNDIEKALQIQKQKGGKLSDVLIGMGLISRSDLVSILSEELGIPPIDLSRYKISQDIIKLISKKTAKIFLGRLYIYRFNLKRGVYPYL